MSVQKCNSGKDFNVDGKAYASFCLYTSGFSVERGTNRSYSSGNLNLKDQSQQAWSTLSTIDSTGSVLFSNLNQGGSLSAITIANRGSQNLYVGFNNGNPSTGSGFLVGTGEAISYEEQVVTKIWAITSTGTSTIGAQGLFQSTKYWEPH